MPSSIRDTPPNATVHSQVRVAYARILNFDERLASFEFRRVNHWYLLNTNGPSLLVEHRGFLSLRDRGLGWHLVVGSNETRRI